MFVIESCQKIEYNALFMMIFIPVSNFGDQPLDILPEPGGVGGWPRQQNKNYEIRKYFDRLVIETNTTQGNGFKKLFNYISGNNEQKKEIKMTIE